MIRNTISTMDEPKVKSMLRKNNNIRPHYDRKETFIKFKKWSTTIIQKPLLNKKPKRQLFRNSS